MINVLVIGANGGVGQSLCQCLSDDQNYQLHALTSKELDLNYPERIFNIDFTTYDIVINCAGHSQGTYKGFLKNSYANQLSQINVNYISNLFLLKHYATSRTSGKYVWISSTLIDHPRPFHSIYASTKLASKFAIDLIRQEATHIKILEVKTGPIDTNFRFRNFEGTLSMSEIQCTRSEHTLDPSVVAKKIVNNLTTDTKEIKIIL